MREYNLQRFLDAQEGRGFYTSYATALKEIRAGKKVSHWIWYVFPQHISLGRSSTAVTFGISSLEEARAYLAHPILLARLVEISAALLELECSDAVVVMGGSTDAMKLRSSMTLFAETAPESEIFRKVLNKFFGGRKDGRTVSLLKRK